MPHHRQVDTLQTISLHRVGGLVLAVAPVLISELNVHTASPKAIITELRQRLTRLSALFLSHVPRHLHDLMAIEILDNVRTLIERTKHSYYHQRQANTCLSAFLAEMNVMVSLTELALSTHLRHIDFSRWPKILRYVLYKNLPRLTGLEVLNLGSCTGRWRTAYFDQLVLNGISGMKHLRSLCLCFDCNDHLIMVLAENCPQLQCLDVTSSRSVTDRSVQWLLKCQQLIELHLYRTSVSVAGLTQLIVGLDRLQDIGRCDEFSDVLNLIHFEYESKGPFNLRKIQTRDLSTTQLVLFVELFPNIHQIRLFHDENTSDLTVLKSLRNLDDLKLLSCAFYTDCLPQLLRICGEQIVSLHMEHMEQIDLTGLIELSQSCPNLQQLILYNCDFVATNQNNNNVITVKMQPFQHLERLFWMVDSAMEHLEFILLHATNIRYVHLGSSTGITHSALVNVLAANPMKKLEEFKVLYSSDMSMRTVELLLASCTNLRVLSELESWQGVSQNEIRQFKEYILANNFDLDVRPTLSYY